MFPADCARLVPYQSVPRRDSAAVQALRDLHILARSARPCTICTSSVQELYVLTAALPAVCMSNYKRFSPGFSIKKKSSLCKGNVNFTEA